MILLLPILALVVAFRRNAFPLQVGYSSAAQNFASVAEGIERASWLKVSHSISQPCLRKKLFRVEVERDFAAFYSSPEETSLSRSSVKISHGRNLRHLFFASRQDAKAAALTRDHFERQRSVILALARDGWSFTAPPVSPNVLFPLDFARLTPLQAFFTKKGSYERLAASHFLLRYKLQQCDLKYGRKYPHPYACKTADFKQHLTPICNAILQNIPYASLKLVVREFAEPLKFMDRLCLENQDYLYIIGSGKTHLLVACPDGIDASNLILELGRKRSIDARGSDSPISASVVLRALCKSSSTIESNRDPSFQRKLQIDHAALLHLFDSFRPAMPHFWAFPLKSILAINFLTFFNLNLSQTLPGLVDPGLPDEVNMERIKKYDDALKITNKTLTDMQHLFKERPFDII